MPHQQIEERVFPPTKVARDKAFCYRSLRGNERLGSFSMVSCKARTTMLIPAFTVFMSSTEKNWGRDEREGEEKEGEGFLLRRLAVVKDV